MRILDAKKINNNFIFKLDQIECLIIDNFNYNIEKKLFYSILDHSKQLDNYIVVNSIEPIKKKTFMLKDLQSRINSFVFIGIFPTDDLLQVIISKTF